MMMSVCSTWVLVGNNETVQKDHAQLDIDSWGRCNVLGWTKRLFFMEFGERRFQWSVDLVQFFADYLCTAHSNVDRKSVV